MIEYHSSTRFTVRYKHYSVKCLHRHKGSSPFGFSSGGGTNGSGGLTRKTKRFPFPDFPSTPLSTPDTNGVSFVTFILAQLWTDLGGVEQTMVDQIIREHLRSREVNDGR